MRYALSASLAAALIASSAPAVAEVADFTGNWQNADPATRGITQLRIHATNGQLMVHVWGKCHPTDCDWGAAPAQLFAPNVGVPIEAGADAAIVQFDQSGIQTMLLLQTSSGGLSFKSFTIMPGDGRSSYHNAGRFGRW